MNCRQIKKQLSVFQDGELAPEQEKTLKVHLRQCEACRTRLQEYRASWDLLEILEDAEPNPYFYTRLKTRIEERRVHHRGFSRLLIPVTAAVMLLLGIWMGNAVTKMGNGTTVATTEQDLMIPALEHFEDFEDFPAESIGKVFTDVATLH